MKVELHDIDYTKMPLVVCMEKLFLEKHGKILKMSMNCAIFFFLFFNFWLIVSRLNFLRIFFPLSLLHLILGSCLTQIVILTVVVSPCICVYVQYSQSSLFNISLWSIYHKYSKRLFWCKKYLENEILKNMCIFLNSKSIFIYLLLELFHTKYGAF